MLFLIRTQRSPGFDVHLEVFQKSQINAVNLFTERARTVTNGNPSDLWTRRRFHHRVTQHRDRRWLSPAVRGKHFQNVCFPMRCVFQFYHFAQKKVAPTQTPVPVRI